MDIAIRADGGSQIGMGHIMRTLVLAKELSKRHNIFYVCRVNNPLNDIYKPGIEKVKLQGYDVIIIDENNIVGGLARVKADILITDSYDVDENYFNETKEFFKKTVYIDDVNKFHFNVDFLINQNPDAKDFQYDTNKNTKLFLGTDYTLIREEFRNSSEKLIKDKAEDILITLGGSDPKNYTGKILDCVKLMGYNFHVVIGPSFYKGVSLKNFESEKIRLYYNADMYKLMQKCDVAVTACGSTIYELCACGVPTLGLIAADNQKGIAKKMGELGLIINMGFIDELNKEIFIKELESISFDKSRRNIMSKEASWFVDGNGVKRVAEGITN